MAKMNELSQALDTLQRCGEMLIETAGTLRELFSTHDPEPAMVAEPVTTTPVVPEPPKPKEKAPSLEELRALLARKSSEGHGEKIQELIRGYGVTKLSQIDPEHYTDLRHAAEVL